MVTSVNKAGITFIVGQLSEKLARWWWCGLVVVSLLLGVLWEDYVEILLVSLQLILAD